MRQYKIFGHPSGLVETVKQGWSWPGFFFIWLWALIKGLWLIGLATFVIQVVASFDPSVSSLVTLVVMIVYGLNGNEWREKDLISKGYSVKGMEIAGNSGAALAAHLSSPQSK